MSSSKSDSLLQCSLSSVTPRPSELLLSSISSCSSIILSNLSLINRSFSLTCPGFEVGRDGSDGGFVIEVVDEVEVVKEVVDEVWESPALDDLGLGL